MEDHRAPEGPGDEEMAFVNSADSHVVEPLDSVAAAVARARLRERGRDASSRTGAGPSSDRRHGDPKKMGSPAVDRERRRGRPRATSRRRLRSPTCVSTTSTRTACWARCSTRPSRCSASSFPIPSCAGRARVDNDWLAETFATASKRFAGAAMIPVHEVATGRRRDRAVAALGLRSLMLPMHPPPDRPYNLDGYDPIWAAAQDHGFPVSFHVGTGASPWTEKGPGGAVINYVEVGLGANATSPTSPRRACSSAFPRCTW